ncbi:MAG: hypothetical protein ACPGJR_14605 [Akkermansiaceae bacterium]
MIKILLYGLTGRILINGKKFTLKVFMPGQGQNPTFKDRDLADLTLHQESTASRIFP